MSKLLGRALLALVIILGVLQPARAVIKKLTPLKDVIGDATVIVVTEVDKVDAEKPSATFKFKENLKGKADAESFPVNLKGDAFAKKDGHTKAMLDRLSPGRKLILFVTQVEKTSIGFGFLEGTWFQLRGTTGDDGKTVTWAFLHCEPFFRRTFKGTTDELKAVVEKAVSGKAAPPDANEKEEPGLGPVPERKGAAIRSPMLFGVIPSAVLIAPLAVVAALFPGVFARLAIAMKQWRAFLAISSINTTLAAAYYFLREYLPDRWIFSPQAFLVLLVIITFIGMLWAGRRYRRLGAEDATVTSTPTKQNLLAMVGFFAGLGAFLLLAAWLFVGRAGLIELPTREFTGMAAGLALAIVYGLYRVTTKSVDGSAKSKLSLSGESVALAGTMLFTVGVLATSMKSSSIASSTGSEHGDAVDSAIGPRLADIRTMTFPGAVEVMSGLALDSNGRLYFGAESKGGTGSVWCADPTTGESFWKFTNGGDLQPVYCMPTIADGKVFVGEGLHTDSDRRMFCLDAKTGTAIGHFKTESHTEGRPALAGNKIVFCAGDDGLYCIDANDRKQLWHFEGLKQKLHVDTPPAVRGRRVFFGSGYNTLALLCADVNTGDELWRTPVDLRSFGAPLARGSHVYYGLGTGNLIEDLSVEAEDTLPRETAAKGAVICVSATTGEQQWRYDLPKSVHSELAADLRTVYACCKDGTVYAIDRASGNLRWKRTVGPSFASGPALATYANGAATLAVYVVTIDGRAACLNPTNGEAFWIRDLAEHSQKLLQVISTPVVISADGKRTLLVGSKAENRNNGERIATIFRIEDVIED